MEVLTRRNETIKIFNGCAVVRNSWFLLLYLDMYKRNTEKSIIDAYLYVLVIVSARGLFI